MVSLPRSAETLIPAQPIRNYRYRGYTVVMYSIVEVPRLFYVGEISPRKCIYRCILEFDSFELGQIAGRKKRIVPVRACSIRRLTVRSVKTKFVRVPRTETIPPGSSGIRAVHPPFAYSVRKMTGRFVYAIRGERSRISDLTPRH